MDVLELIGKKVESRFLENCPVGGGVDGLVRVTLEKDSMDVTLLEPPRIEIPFVDLIEATLNSALIGRFNLDTYFSDCDTGVCGYVEGKPWNYVTLVNKPDLLGLQVSDPRMSLSALPVFDFYYGLIKKLFLEQVTFRGFQYPRGEILRLPTPQNDYTNVLFSLAAAIEDIGGQNFRERVFDKLDRHFPLSLMVFD